MKTIMMECTFNMYIEETSKKILEISEVKVLENGTNYLILKV